ncbi:unnamed protein product [Linum trigynum]|uniref:Uncharacterized protein n=1 Tax=Linum trigynum TaxID=586398 RepID=A0AAV2CVM3_9ROSI
MPLFSSPRPAAKTHCTRIQSNSKFGSFDDLKPDFVRGPIIFSNLLWHDPTSSPQSSQFDVIINSSSPPTPPASSLPLSSWLLELKERREGWVRGDFRFGTG